MANFASGMPTQLPPHSGYFGVNTRYMILSINTLEYSSKDKDSLIKAYVT